MARVSRGPRRCRRSRWTARRGSRRGSMRPTRRLPRARSHGRRSVPEHDERLSALAVLQGRADHPLPPRRDLAGPVRIADPQYPGEGRMQHGVPKDSKFLRRQLGDSVGADGSGQTREWGTCRSGRTPSPPTTGRLRGAPGRRPAGAEVPAGVAVWREVELWLLLGFTWHEGAQGADHVLRPGDGLRERLGDARITDDEVGPAREPPRRAAWAAAGTAR